MENRDSVKLTLVGGHYSKGGFAQALTGREDVDEYTETIGAAFFRTKITTDDKSFTVEIWDTAENPRYHALIPMYMCRTNIIFYFINLNDENGIQECEEKLEVCRQFEDIPHIIIGNCKQNEERRIARDTAFDFAARR